MPYQEERRIKYNAGILLERVNQYSQEAAQGSFEGALSLLRQLIPSGPDQGPEIKVTPELLQTLNPREALAIDIAKKYSDDFNRNFGVGTSMGESLNANNRAFKYFVFNLGKTIQGIIHPEGPYGKDLIENMVLMQQGYLGLINWANNLFEKAEAK